MQPIKLRTNAPRQTEESVSQRYRHPQQPTGADDENPNAWTLAKPHTSAVRYIDREGNPVFRQGNREFIIHAEPPPRQRRRPHWIVISGLTIIAVVLLIWFVSWLSSWWTEHNLDTTYEFPRISQADAVVYPGDTSDHPSHYLFLNLQGTVLIIEFPHGDPTKAKTYIGPTIFTDNAANVPITGEFRVVNNKIEMLVHIQVRIILYVNDGTKFKPQGGIMFQVEDEQQKIDHQHTGDEPTETYHLYVVREGQLRPSIAPIAFSILALIILIAVGMLIPYQQPQERKVIRIPAIFLPLKTFTTSVAVVPTGIKQYPATTAHGILTITNGSILAEELPKGIIFTGRDGTEVITDHAVFIPAGSAAGYGIAYVSSHAVGAGAAGNIPALDINSVEGTALYIRNLQSFSGGADSYAIKYITSQDRDNALTQARAILLPQTLSGLLQSPCTDIVTGDERLSVRWTCQFVSYSVPDLPGVRVLSAQIKGKTILLEVVYVARPRIVTVK